MAVDNFVDQYRAQQGSLPGAEQAWLRQLRREGIELFGRIGFPSVRDEDWRYTEVRPITGKYFSLPAQTDHRWRLTPAQLRALAIDGYDGLLVVLMNGVFAPDLSSAFDPADGVEVLGLEACLRTRPEQVKAGLGRFEAERHNGFSALHRAFLRDGVVISSKPGAALRRPIQILHVAGDQRTASQPLILVDAGADSRLEIIERYVSSSDAATLTNSATAVTVGKQAQLDYYVVQTPSEHAYQVSELTARLHANSRFSCRTLTTGGALIRNQVRVELLEPGAHCDLLGLYGLSGRQHVDNHTTLLHAADNCTSRELYKGVLDQRARAVFHGRITVSPGAWATDATQANNTLLLSREAEIDTKPQLEIYADEVKCAHGATVGQLDADALFYLRSRGLEQQQARALLTFAFVNDVLAEVDIQPLRAAMEHILAARLTPAEQLAAVE